jgi:putative DNA primase/helicase
MTTVTFFDSIFAKAPGQVQAELDTASFREVVSTWSHQAYAKKDDAPVFSLCVYGVAKNRQKANILTVTGIVLDIDSGNTVDQIMAAAVKLEPYAHCWYTTYSHTEKEPKVRIIVPLAHPVTPKQFNSQALALRLAAWLSLTVDACCADAAQVYYMPSKSSADAECYLVVGESTTAFDTALLPAQAAKAGKSGSAKTDSETQPIYQQINAIVASQFGGIAPYFFGDKFHLYINGVWHAVDSGRPFVRDMIEIYSHKVNVPVITELVTAMKIVWSIEQLPAPASHKITLTNGTWDTETKTLEAHSPENHHSSGMAFDYDVSATCPLWLVTLDGVFRDDADKELKIRFLQEWFGYLLTPSTKYQVMVWLYGGGANGKSVITRMARELLGTDNVSSIPLAQLGARFIGAELLGKLANIVDEIATNGLMQEDELKKIVSGDPITVERKNKDPFVFSPTARIFAATNTLPPSKDSTHGLDRRLIVMPCNRTFRPEEMDRDLVGKLIDELPGIFVWALEGHARLKAQDKFTAVPSCIAAMEDFKVCRNSASLFKRDCLELPGLTDVDSGLSSKAFRTPSRELYEAYKAYCGANRYQAFGNEIFGKKLNEMGIKQIRTGGKRYYLAKTVNLEEFGIGQERLEGPSGPTKTDIDDEFDGFAEAA